MWAPIADGWEVTANRGSAALTFSMAWYRWRGLLDDARLKAKAQRYIDWTLDHQAPNGMIGPASNDDWWPRYRDAESSYPIPGVHWRFSA